MTETALVRANRLVREKRYVEALTLYQHAIEETPEMAHLIRANIALAQRWLERAPLVGNSEPDAAAPDDSLDSPPSALEKPQGMDDHTFERIRQSGLFDLNWFMGQYRDRLQPGENPLAHYLAHGVEAGLNPSPGFDTRYYLESNPDVARAGIHPFAHYVLQGCTEGRRPFPQPVADYDARYPVAQAAYVPRLPAEAGPPEKAVRVIAFYLPQFHAIPENDAWWGDGFTEWTNVKPAQPRFAGHYQPHEPDEYLGHYNLLDGQTQAKQVVLAKQYGIEGFCFYLYWFMGKRLLEQPLDAYLADPALDLPFCVCWANENWSRRWDGLDQDVLIAQHYSDADDLAFIAHTAKYLGDPRYIRIDGKPLLLIYRPSLFPDIRATVRRWRGWCRDNGIGEIYLAYPQSFECVDPAEYGFDAAVEFPPNNSNPPDITRQIDTPRPDFKGRVYDWRVFVERGERYQNPGYTLFRGLNPAWDNTARKKHKGAIFHNACPVLFRRWVVNAFADTLNRFPSPDARLVFVNAWNEWAEGAHLEPDRRYGYAWLQAIRDAHATVLRKQRRIVVVSHDAHPHGAQILCLHFARHFKEQLGFEVDLIVLGEGRLIPKFGQYAQVHRIDLDRNEPGEIDRLLATLRRRGAEVAIANTTVSGRIVPWLKAQGFQVLALIHELPGILASYGLHDHAWKIAKHADRVVFPAEQVKQGFEAFLGQPLKQAAIRPQGLYRRSPLHAGADKSATRAEVRRELGLADDARLILCIGYADRRKGFDLFVEACLEVFKQAPNAYALWVGHLDEPFVHQALEAAERAGQSRRFLLPGLVESPQRYYLAADIYALTSREDPFPSVVMEALDALSPVVAFKDGGGYETLLARGCGVLVPMEDVAAFADAVTDLLEHPDKARALAETGRRIVEAEFSFRHYLFDLLALAGRPLPRVSAIVPNYNYARYLSDRLQTLIGQSLPIHELIVLDDCSTDDSVALAREVLKNHELPWRLEVNSVNSGSVFRQWRKGLEMAHGDYVWIAEADDTCKPQFLQAVVQRMEESGAVLGFADSWQIDEEGRQLGESYKPYVNQEAPGAFDMDFIMEGREFLENHLGIKNVILNVSCVVFRRDALLQAMDQIGEELFDYKVAGDWRIYAELCTTGGKVAYVAETLNGHRRHRTSVTHALQVEKHLDEIKHMHGLVVRQIGLSSSFIAMQEKHRQACDIHLRNHTVCGT